MGDPLRDDWCQKSDYMTLLYFSSKVYSPPVETIARQLFDLMFDLQKEKCRDMINFQKIPFVKVFKEKS